MGLHKISKIVAFALAIIGAIIALLIMKAGDTDPTTLKLSEYMMYITYIIMVIVLVLVIIFVLKGLFAGDLKKTLITVGAFLAVIFISYGISSGTDLDLKPFTDEGFDVNESISKTVGAGLYAFYALASIAIAAMLFSGAKKLFNK